MGTSIRTKVLNILRVVYDFSHRALCDEKCHLRPPFCCHFCVKKKKKKTNYELLGPHLLGFQYLSLIDTDDHFMPNLVTIYKRILFIRFVVNH